MFCVYRYSLLCKAALFFYCTQSPNQLLIVNGVLVHVSQLEQLWLFRERFSPTVFLFDLLWLEVGGTQLETDYVSHYPPHTVLINQVNQIELNLDKATLFKQSN